MKKYITLEKIIGETPLETIHEWKREHPEYANVAASYAGRLDPMASGKLLVLLGDECKKQKHYTKLDKEYDIEILFDVGSDTGDALGLTTYAEKTFFTSTTMLKQVIAREVGKHMRPYPQFSSRPVNGKPLFLHVLEGTIGDITIPEHEEQIYRIVLQHIKTISAQDLALRIDDFLARTPTTDEPSKKLGADFRIADVRAGWKDIFARAGERNFIVASLRVTCGSGTYMRALAPRIGAALGTRALALSIHRTTIGKYWWGLWVKRYR